MLFYEGNPLVVNYVWGEENEVPTLIVSDDVNMYFYQAGGYEMSGDDHPVAGNFHVSYVEVTPVIMIIMARKIPICCRAARPSAMVAATATSAT